MTSPSGSKGYETNPKKRPRHQYDCGVQDTGFTGRLEHLGFDPEDSQALERVVLESPDGVQHLRQPPICPYLFGCC